MPKKVFFSKVCVTGKDVIYVIYVFDFLAGPASEALAASRPLVAWLA